MAIAERVAVSHGQVVAQYRKRKHWTQEQLAEALRVDKRTVQRMESQELISSEERRRLLVGVLGIPAALMSVEDEQNHFAETPLAVNPDRMAFFETELVTRWEMFHYSSTARAARGLDMWTREITQFAATTRGTGWQDRAYALLAMSYQLQTSTYRDMQLYEQAHQSYERALRIGKALDNQELIASAMAREGLTLLQQERIDEAIAMLRGALEAIRNLGLPHLKGYILQGLSEAYAKAHEGRLCWQAIGLAERALERTDSAQEMSKALITQATITAQKGVDAVLLGEYERAISLIERGLTTYDPTMVRARSRLLAQKAEAYQALRQIDACVATAEEALSLARSVGSRKTISRLETLHATLAQSRANSTPGVARLRALLLTT